MKNLNHMTEIQTLIARGALFVVNHSGGKDSQAMMIEIRKIVPASQILVIHADLAEVEWKGTMEHARDSAGSHEFRVVKAVKTFFEMVDHRQNWPSPQYRQCTSDLKVGPIEKAIRHFLKEKNLSGLVVNCMGIRAEESSQRSKRDPFKKNEKNSKAGREWYDWLPIFEYTTEKVFSTIAESGEKPHWAYGKGMTRLSCAFCIMSSKGDLRIAARENPELFQKILAKEKEIGKTMFAVKGQPFALDEYMKEKTKTVKEAA